jgi:drug/metabolite transporter (DMT)-like permease
MASREKTLFAAVFGILYLLFGITMIVSALVPALAELAVPYLIPVDPAAGFVLCVVGAVFISACRRQETGTTSRDAYLYVGMVLSVIFGIVALLSLLAQGADVVIFSEGEPWDPVQVLVPMVWLAIIPGIGFYAWGRGFVSDLTRA